MKGLVLAGGKGTRLRPFTHTGPKQLIPIANKPVLLYAVEDLLDAGIREIGIVVGYTPDRIQQVKDAVGDGASYGARISYIEQDAPRGIAHAIYVAREFLGNDPFVVYLGDNVVMDGIKRYVSEYAKSDFDAGVLLAKVNDPPRYGVVEFDKNGNIIDIEEKPIVPKSNVVLTGVYFFTSCVFDVIKGLKPSSRNELEISDTIKALVKSKDRRVAHYIVEGWWDDTGRPEDIIEANRHILDRDLKPSIIGHVEDGAVIQDRVQIGEGTVVEDDAVIRGPVRIGKHSRIGHGSHVGPYTSIGDRCILENANVEHSVILDDVRIETSCKLVDSLIGKRTSIASRKNSSPKGHILILGEDTTVCLDDR